MRSMDEKFGDIMGIVIVLGLVALAIVTADVIAGWFIIPILLAVAVPIFLIWFAY